LLDWVGEGELEGKRVDIEVARRDAMSTAVRVACDEAERARAEWNPTRVAWIGAVVRGGFARRLPVLFVGL
jgi:hypothetical protein